MKINRISSLFMAVLVFIALLPIRANAMDISFAITPSKIYDECINLGESKDFLFDITNKSVGENSTLKIDISTSIENELGGMIDDNSIVTLDKKQVNVQSNNIEAIPVKVSIPKDFQKGSYTIYINFTQSAENQAYKNVIRVPMYIYVGEKVEYDSLQIDYDIQNERLYYQNSEKTTVIKEVGKNIIKLLNPLNIPEVFEDIKYKPIYAFEEENNVIYDINNDIYTELKNVSTTNKNYSDNKYVYYEKDWLDYKVNKTVGNENSLVIYLDNDKEVSIYGDNMTVKYMTSQLSNIAKNNKNINLQYLMDNLKVLRNKTYSKQYPTYEANIINNSEIPITLNGTYKFIKDNSDTIEDGKFSSITVKKQETSIYKETIYKELTEGTYNLNGNISAKNTTNLVNETLQIENKRDFIMIICAIFVMIYIVFVLVIIYILIRKIIKRKNK